MAIALVAHASGTGAAKIATSAAMDTTGATLLVAIASGYAGSELTWSFSDSKGNSNWTKLTNRRTVENPQVQIAYCYGLTSVGSGHTVSADAGIYANDGYVAVTVLAFSGTLTTSGVFNVESGGVVAASNTSVPTGSLTPASGDVLVCGLGMYNGTPTISDGITILDSQSFNAASYMKNISAYKLDPGASAIDPTWTCSDTTYPRPVAAASFKSDGSGGASGQPLAKRFGGIPFVGQSNAGISRW